MKAEVKIPKRWRQVRPGAYVHVGDKWKDVEDGRAVGRWQRIRDIDLLDNLVRPASREIVIRRVRRKP